MKTESPDILLQTLRTRLFISITAALLFACCTGFSFFILDWFGSATFNLAFIPCIIIILYGAASIILSYFQQKAAMEEEDRILLEKRGKRARTFDSDEDILFTASRTLNSYRKYAPYVFAVLSALVIAGGLYFFSDKWTSTSGNVIPAKPKQAAFIACVFALLAFFTGIFCTGQSRIKNFRWLRPVGIWLILLALQMIAASVAILLKDTGIPSWDRYLSKFFFAVFAVLAAELLLNFVIEFYRPRTGMEERPLFESRILSIITEPGGILRNIADTLDYQFGFQVSGTWIYRFLEKSISPLILIWFALFWTATAFDEIPSGYMGVMERFGERVSDGLEPGFYLKWPWPIENIKKFPVDKVQQIFIGPELKDKKGEEKRPDVVLWTQMHYAKENPFLVAITPETTKNTHESKKKELASVALMSALFPIQFKIRHEKLIDYAYKNKEPVKTLKYIAEKEISSYLASSDMMKVMSTAREETAETIKRNIQAAVEKAGLGVEIIAVTLLDAHPPISGGEGDEGSGLPQTFQDVIGAQEKKETKILEAEKYKTSVIPAAEAEAYKIVSEAESYKDNKIKVAEAEMERFKKRIAGYRAMPEQYILNEKMNFLENDCKNLRKYIVPASSKNDVYIINLEEKRRLDLIDINDLKDESAGTKAE